MNMNINKFLFLYLIIFSYILSVVKSQPCSTNLECKMTGCCHDDVCSDEGKCKKRNKFCYAFVGVGAFIIIVIIIVYFIGKIKATKKQLEYLKKTDPGSLSRNRRNSQAQLPSI